MKAMTRDGILKPIELKTTAIEIDGWGSFNVKQMSQATASKLSLWLSPKGKFNESRQSQHRLKMVTLCVVDEKGATILSEDDIPTLEQQPAGLILELVTAVLDINGYLDDDEDDDLLGKSEDS